MNGGSIEGDTVFGTGGREVTYWHRAIPAIGVAILVGAIAKSVATFASSGILLEAVLDMVLVGSLGIVTLYIGLWLPNTTIRPEFYPRIVLWVFGGVAVMGVVLGLRVLHPGVNVEFAFGTQAVFLAIGSIAGLGIGVHEAEALIHAKRLEEQNEELKRAEEQLEEAVTQLEASNDRLEQFAYAASHDLQEPLRMVSSYLQLLRNRYGAELDEDAREYIEFAVDGADRMRAMVDDLLAYSRVEQAGGEFEPVECDAVLEHVVDDLQVQIQESDAEIVAESLPTVTGDREQLEQLFRNLVSNAIKYGGEDPPTVEITAERRLDRWQFAVADDGIGIDPEKTDRIFEVFKRLHNDDEYSGTGIGLSLCQEIVENHGGDIWVESEPGEGSTFFFTLPTSPANARSRDRP